MRKQPYGKLKIQVSVNPQKNFFFYNTGSHCKHFPLARLTILNCWVRNEQACAVQPHGSQYEASLICKGP